MTNAISETGCEPATARWKAETLSTRPRWSLELNLIFTSESCLLCNRSSESEFGNVCKKSGTERIYRKNIPLYGLSLEQWNPSDRSMSLCQLDTKRSGFWTHGEIDLWDLILCEILNKGLINNKAINCSWLKYLFSGYVLL